MIVSIVPAACASHEPQPYAGFVDEPVAAVASQIAGRVSTIMVREGDRVTRGQPVAQLDATLYQAAVEQAQANLDRAHDALSEARANLSAASPVVTGARADIARARAARDVAEDNYQRAQTLARTGAMSAQDLDAAASAYRQAQASLDAMTAARLATVGRLAAADAAVANARSAVRSSEAALRYTQAQLDQSRIVSPFDGLVVARNVEEGEWAAPGTPVVTIEDTGHPWVRLDVPETTFTGLHLGQLASVHVLSFGRRILRGHVTQIGAEGDFAINRDVKRGRPDIRTFLVRVAFDETPSLLRPGMTAEVQLLPYDARTASLARGAPR